MPTYIVEVCRIGEGHVTFEVTTDDELGAEIAALQRAYDHVFSDNASKYEIMNVVEK
jgi:hypothetical protein